MPRTGKRTFKVRSSEDQSVRFGITVADPTVDIVLSEACEKLKISPRGCTLRAIDGTIIDDDDYLVSDDLKYPNNNVVIVPKASKSRTDSVDDLLGQLDGIVDALQTHHNQRPDEVRWQIEDHRKSSSTRNIAAGGIQEVIGSTAKKSSRHDDPDWFIQVKPRFKTKEHFMRDRARSRVAGYLNVTKDFINRCDDDDKKKIMLAVYTELIVQLKAVNYFESYFDREDGSNASLCDRRGNFPCGGIYNKAACEYKSIINPYASLRKRIEFSSWNLDHIVEKSRSVLPCLEKAAGEVLQNKRYQVNVDYFFRLLFTTDNLKLVETACHDKTEHTDKQCVLDSALTTARRR